MNGDAIEFKITTRSVEYGDHRKFIEYKIQMFCQGKIAGVESGPRRSTPDRPSALKSARRRVAVLRGHRLYAIRVTRKHISDGQARSCQSCAISQALWHNQERMGFTRGRYDSARFEVAPYGCFVDPRGITLRENGDDYKERQLLDMPDLCGVTRSGKIYSDSMVEWAMNWDEWAESREISLTEWREKHGYEKGDFPCRPCPASFVLDLSALLEQPEVEL